MVGIDPIRARERGEERNSTPRSKKKNKLHPSSLLSLFNHKTPRQATLSDEQFQIAIASELESAVAEDRRFYWGGRSAEYFSIVVSRLYAGDLNAATARGILDAMAVPGLTLDRVRCHLEIERRLHNQGPGPQAVANQQAEDLAVALVVEGGVGEVHAGAVAAATAEVRDRANLPPGASPPWAPNTQGLFLAAWVVCTAPGAAARGRPSRMIYDWMRLGEDVLPFNDLSVHLRTARQGRVGRTVIPRVRAAAEAEAAARRG